jgi:hypothetical protein
MMGDKTAAHKSVEAGWRWPPIAGASRGNYSSVHNGCKQPVSQPILVAED